MPTPTGLSARGCSQPLASCKRRRSFPTIRCNILLICPVNIILWRADHECPQDFHTSSELSDLRGVYVLKCLNDQRLLLSWRWTFVVGLWRVLKELNIWKLYVKFTSQRIFELPLTPFIVFNVESGLSCWARLRCVTEITVVSFFCGTIHACHRISSVAFSFVRVLRTK